jgi:hypothetical protein
MLALSLCFVWKSAVEIYQSSTTASSASFRQILSVRVMFAHQRATDLGQRWCPSFGHKTMLLSESQERTVTMNPVDIAKMQVNEFNDRSFRTNAQSYVSDNIVVIDIELGQVQTSFVLHSVCCSSGSIKPPRCIQRSASHEVRLVLLRKDACSQLSSAAHINFRKDRFQMILNRVR